MGLYIGKGQQSSLTRRTRSYQGSYGMHQMYFRGVGVFLVFDALPFEVVIVVVVVVVVGGVSLVGGGGGGGGLLGLLLLVVAALVGHFGL